LKEERGKNAGAVGAEFPPRSGFEVGRERELELGVGKERSKITPQRIVLHGEFARAALMDGGILGGLTTGVMAIAIWRFNRGKIFE